MLGVDVDERMADLARQSWLEVEVAAFEAWDPAGRAFDAVVSGQTWHWIDPVAGAAKAAEVLRPGGRLAVFWNVFQPPPEVAEAFSAVYLRVLPDLPFNWAMPALDGYSVLFAKEGRWNPGSERVRRLGAVAIPLGAVLHAGRVAGPDTYSRRPQPAPAGQAGRVAGGHRSRHRRGGGRFTMRYTTVVVTAARTDAA